MSRPPRKKPKGTLALLTDERQEMIRPEVLGDLTEAERAEIFYQEIAAEDSMKNYVAPEDPESDDPSRPRRMYEEEDRKRKSLSFRGFERYCTQARRPLPK